MSCCRAYSFCCRCWQRFILLLLFWTWLQFNFIRNAFRMMYASKKCVVFCCCCRTSLKIWFALFLKSNQEAPHWISFWKRMQSIYFIGFVKGLPEYLFIDSINKSSSANLQGFLLLQLLPMMMMMAWLVVFFVAFVVYIIFIVCKHVLHHWLPIALSMLMVSMIMIPLFLFVVHFISKVKHIKMRCHCVQIVFILYHFFSAFL